MRKVVIYIIFFIQLVYFQSANAQFFFDKVEEVGDFDFEKPAFCPEGTFACQLFRGNAFFFIFHPPSTHWAFPEGLWQAGRAIRYMVVNRRSRPIPAAQSFPNLTVKCHAIGQDIENHRHC